MDAKQLEIDLASFTGTEQYHRYWMGLKLTDGAKYLADQAGAYWLMDAIASYQPEAMRDPMLCEMQFWKLKVNADKSATLTCERDTDDVAFKQEIGYTDFPLDSVKVYVQNGVILLPSEY